MPLYSTAFSDRVLRHFFFKITIFKFSLVNIIDISTNFYIICKQLNKNFLLDHLWKIGSLSKFLLC